MAKEEPKKDEKPKEKRSSKIYDHPSSAKHRYEGKEGKEGSAREEKTESKAEAKAQEMGAEGGTERAPWHIQEKSRGGWNEHGRLC